jgi:alpha,alpha-trehalase
MTSFAPLQPIDGYLRLEDYGLIGDGATAALVGRDGTVAWMCVPRFDSPPLFCRTPDVTRGGAFTVSPEDRLESRQCYEPESPVRVTDMRSPSGLVRLTDALTLRSGADLTEGAPAGRGEPLRSAAVLNGRVRLRVEITPRGGAAAERRRGGCGCVAPRVPTSSCSSPAPERWTVMLHR